MIDAAGELGAPVILGSMQGRWSEKWNATLATRSLANLLAEYGERAAKHNVPFLYEPLNRYETNLANSLGRAVELIAEIPGGNVRLLADLFHMNIEEADLAAAIRAAGRYIGHVHFADSNRRPAGFGHTDFVPIASALRDIGYAGYVSAECFPYPDSAAAARATSDAFNRHFR
jgi:sugar phosphate isomerase/epimerase